MKRSASKAPIDRAPAVTIVLLEADAPNLGARVLEAASQDYFGPVEILAIAEKDAAGLARRAAEHPWVAVAPRAAKGGAAVELALSLSAGTYLGLLPRNAHPHPLWIEAVVATAVEHPDAFAVAPRIVRSSGALLAAGVVRGPEGIWRGSDAENGEEKKPIDAAVGDGLLVSVEALRRCLPLDESLDARALGVDLSLAARRLRRPIYLSRRARVVVASGGAGNGEGRLRLDGKSELLLIAKHDPDGLPRWLGASDVLLGREKAEASALLREALSRAGLELKGEGIRWFAESLGVAAARTGEKSGRIRELEERVAELERQSQENATRLHKEMAWAHELDGRLRQAHESHASERARLESEQGSLAAELRRDADWLRSELAATQENLGIAERDLGALRTQLQQGADPNDLRIRDLEQRWRRAEERSEAAQRELGTAQERMRLLEQAFRTLERAQVEVARRRGTLEAQLQRTLETAKQAEERERSTQGKIQEASEERSGLLARLHAAEAGFEAAAQSLHTNKMESDRLRARLAESETRRETAEAALRDTQESGEGGSLRRELEAANARVEAAEGRLAEQSARLAELRQQYDQVQGENARLTAEREGHAERAAKARAEAAELGAKLAAAASAREALARDLAARDRELAAARVEFEGARRNLEARLAEKTALAAEQGAALEVQNRKLAEQDAALASVRASLAKESAALAASQRSLAAARADLDARTRDLDETSSALASERAAHARARGERDSLRAELAAERAALAQSQRSLAEVVSRLDGAFSSLAERVGDLARLRAAMLEERDLAAERIVGLIEESRRRRIFRRELRAWERDFLSGPGAGFVREAIR